MDNTLLRRLLEDEEGLKLKAYQDSKHKIWHIGYGHNFEIVQSAEEIRVLTGTPDDPETIYNPDLKDYKNIEVTLSQADALLDIDIADAIDDLAPAFMPEDIEAFNATRRAVIISMVFQMGGSGVRKFKNFISEVKSENWERASLEMLYSDPDTRIPSQWYLDTPKRCQRAADAMRIGYFKEYANEHPRREETAMVSSALANVSDDELLTELTRRIKKK